MKRLLALILALTLVLTALPFQAFAAKGGKLIAITFDDGPDGHDTPRLLDGLKERGVSVTFFVQGQSAKYNSELVRRAYDEGHEIASHTWDHPQLTAISLAEVERQIADTEAVLDTICGEGTEYLVRPPYGSTNEQVREVIDCPMIIWSADTLDWQLLNSYAVRDAIIQKAFDGGIVLLHDIHSTSVTGALMAIDILLDWGYELVTVSELYRRRGVELKGHERYYMEPPNGYEDPGPIAMPEITYTTDGVTMEVTIHSDSDAPVYYTTDGSVPRGGSRAYTGPFTVLYPCEIRAVAAYKLNGSRSRTAELSFGAEPSAAPEFQVEDMVLTLTHPEEGVNIFYTVNGAPAESEGILYTEPVELPGVCTLRLVAAGGGWSMSNEVVVTVSERSVLYAGTALPEHRWFDALDRLISMGLVSGTGDYRYDHNGKVSRGMMVELLYRGSNDKLEEGWETTHTFADVKEKDYFAEAVEWAFRNQIVSGVSEREFQPGNLITRQEMYWIIDGYLEYRGTPLEKESSEVFHGYAYETLWIRSLFLTLSSGGLCRGTDRNLTGVITRGELASVLVQMLDYQASYLPEA